MAINSCKLIIYVVFVLLNEILIDVCGLSIDEKTERKLNIRTYDRVLDIIAPMEATANIQPVDVDVNNECAVIYFDKTCADSNYGIKHLSTELIKDISKCYHKNPSNAQINDIHDKDYFVFVSLDSQKTQCNIVTNDNNNNILIDMQAFCISNIEDEKIYHTDDIMVQPNPQPWNLEFIEKIYPNMASYDDYHYNNFQHNNLNVYILDQKVQLTHTEFANIPTKAYLGVNGGPHEPWDHGTHVAGTIVGRTVGIIRDPSVGLYSYSACMTSGSCYWSDITAGLTLIRDHLIANPTKRGVINYSVGGGFSTAYDTYLADIRAEGGIFVTSAGNSNTDACNQSPAHSSDAIAVGSYDDTNWRSSFSNYGDCINAWAPGRSIYSSKVTSSYGTMSGTSMASPAIAGVIGRLLLHNNALTFAQIANILSCPSFGGTVSGANSAMNTCFGASVGDMYTIASNPMQCNSLAITNLISIGDSVTGDIGMIGQTNRYRVKVTSGPQNIVFTPSGTTTCLSIHNLNFGTPPYDEQCGSNQLELFAVPSGDYWLSIAGDIGSIGSYTVAMTESTDTAMPTTPSESPTNIPTRNPTQKPTANPIPADAECDDEGSSSCHQADVVCCQGLECQTTTWWRWTWSSCESIGSNANELDLPLAAGPKKGKIETETSETRTEYTKTQKRTEIYGAKKAHAAVDNYNNETDSLKNLLDGNDENVQNVRITFSTLSVVTVFALILVVSIGICYACSYCICVK